MERNNEQINMYEFSFLTNMVDNCIKLFYLGVSPEECFKKVKELSEEYKDNLSQEKIVELLGEVKILFIKYFSLLSDYNKLTSKKSKLDINSLCNGYINLRENILFLNKNMLSTYYLDLEKKITIQLQSISKSLKLEEDVIEPPKWKINL